MKSYYYFYTSLKDIYFGMEKSPYDLKDFVENIKDAIDPIDFEIIRAYLYRFDNKNLVNVMEGKEEFSDFSFYSKTDLEEEIKIPSRIPIYMQDFIESQNLDRNELSDYSLEDQLSIYYYKYLMSLSDEFMKKYTEFDFNLKNVLGALNSRKFKLEHGKSVLDLNEDSENLIHSTSGDFGLSTSYSWLSDILRTFEDSNALDFQKKLDKLRFDMLDSMITFEYFNVRSILAYLIKFLIVNRWLSLDKNEGIKRFEKITENMVEGINISTQ